MGPGIYLPAAFDPRTVVPGAEADNRDALLVARMECLARILFNQQLCVSEGWSIDSRPFLQVTSEILEASDEHPRSGAFRSLVPIVSETRLPGENHFEKTCRYVNRPSVEWAGMPQLRDPAVREDLAHRLSELRNTEFVSDDALILAMQEPLSEATGDEDFARWSVRVGRYLMKEETRKVNQIVRNLIFSRFSARLGAVRQMQQVKESYYWMKSLNEITRACDLETHDLSTSRLVAICHGNADDDLAGFLELLIRLSYMQIAVGAPDGEYSSPLLKHGTSPLTTELASSFAEANHATLTGTVEHQHLTLVDGRLRSQLARVGESQWKSIWLKVIDLVLLPEWTQALSAFKAEARSNSDRLSSLRSFDRLQALVQRHCPELSVRESGLRRIFVGIHSRVEKIAEVSIEQTPPAAVALATQSWKVGVVLAAATFLGQLPLSKFGINPASDSFVFGGRKTILDAVVRG